MKSLHWSFSLIQQEEEASQLHFSKNEKGRKKKGKGRQLQKVLDYFSLHIAP